MRVGLPQCGQTIITFATSIGAGCSTMPPLMFRCGLGRVFDGRGNYTLGLKEQLVFPEIEYDKIDRLRGLEITIVTTAKTDEEGRALLEALGMPFRASAGRAA